MTYRETLRGEHPAPHLDNTNAQSSSGYAPPPGPPPGYQEQYMPPSGPPPSHGERYAPPPGPPPSQAPQHNWQAAVPDTSLLPPPPSLGEDRSPTNNASISDAKNGEEWCRRRPLQAPLHVVNRQALIETDSGDVTLNPGIIFVGDLRQTGRGRWYGRTRPKSADSCILSTVPLYSVEAHSPLLNRSSKTIYFEVKILPTSRASEVSLGLGFVAQPYPPFRLPGWERASLGVHGDDGHRYVNDKWGGKDFTTPFKPGQTLGIGMVFSRRVRDQQPVYNQSSTQTTPINVEVFFTKDGQKAGGWDLHEELDASQDLPVHGLEGMHDLFAAVGTFDAVEFEAKFSPQDWLYTP